MRQRVCVSELGHLLSQRGFDFHQAPDRCVVSGPCTVATASRKLTDDDVVSTSKMARGRRGAGTKALFMQGLLLHAFGFALAPAHDICSQTVP